MKKIIVSLLVLTLSACGWHLRGSAAGEDKLAMTTPLDLVMVTQDDHTPLVNALRQTLPSYKINELDTATTGALTLNLSREVLDKRTAGVGSDALTSAYEIILRVDYSISNASGVITPLDTNARTSRTYNYNVNNANSAAQEEELVLREMRRELANNILRRVKNLSAKATTAPTPAAQ
ncbi:MAG: LPS assembly lipoprotein LptE [Cellvibrio sp.]|uniref:LPS-assembly lipoprotein LptE n=1 Tax=Cellvibrio sp. TaxID=1965322 RepID=UPI00272589A0|nr:LPS assembly lipoprotein LptE [Cellvibrio sp.]